MTRSRRGPSPTPGAHHPPPPSGPRCARAPLIASSSGRSISPPAGSTSPAKPHIARLVPGGQPVARVQEIERRSLVLDEVGELPAELVHRQLRVAHGAELGQGGRVVEVV